MMNFQPPDFLTKHLDVKERLIWWDQPKQGLMLRANDRKLIPYSIMSAGFVIFWQVGVMGSGAPLFFKSIGFVFVAVALYMLIGRFFHDAWIRKHTYYGLSSERVLIATPSRLRSLELAKLNDVTFNEFSDGTGSIDFGGNDVQLQKERKEDEEGLLNLPIHPPNLPIFERIRDASRVYSEIRTQQKKLNRK